MTKPVENPAIVQYVSGNPFDIAAQNKAVVLLSNNCVWLKNNYILDTYMTDVAKRETLIELYDRTPTVTLEAALDASGKPLNGFDASVPLMLHQYETGPYDPRKMGRIMILDRNALLIIHTHYHEGKKVAFSYPAFTKALVEYCQLATMEGRQNDPVVIPMPGIDCCDTKIMTSANSYAVDTDHALRIQRIIASTMFPNANVILVSPF